MEQRNPYTPPAANVEQAPIDPQQQSSGLGLGASMLWRVFVFHVALMAIIIPLGSYIGQASSKESLMAKPSLFFLVAAVVLAGSLIVTKQGFLNFFWGYRLNVRAGYIRGFSWALCGLYLLLAIGNISVASLASFEVWIKYKAFVPMAGIFALCFLAPAVIARPQKQ